MEEGFAQRDRSLQLLVQRLEEVTSKAGKEQERLATSLQVVAEGAQRELNSAKGRLLKRLQGVEQHWEEVSSGSALLCLQSLCSVCTGARRSTFSSCALSALCPCRPPSRCGRQLHWSCSR